MTAGDLGLPTPKLRTARSVVVERRRRAEHAVFAVVMEADLHGAPTRKVDDLVKVLSANTGINKSEMPRICA